MTLSILTSDLSKKDKLGLDFLNACYFGNVRLALQLLENKDCPIDWADPRDGWSSIHYSARWGKIKILDALLKNGIDINLQTSSKETALHKACRSNRKNVCVWLLFHGANPDLFNSAGERASDLTLDSEIKYICNHFNEFVITLNEHKKSTKNVKKQNII